MVCFCKQTAGQLQLMLPALNASASASAQVSAQASLRASAALSAAPLPALSAIAAGISKFGLPAEPWQPDPAWLQMPLPKMTLSASAMATLSAFAQLQATAAMLGLNLQVAAQATAFARLAATISARLDAMLAAGDPIMLNASAYAELAASLTASAQVQSALSLGLLPTPPAMGPPLSLWRAFLSELRSLLPMIAMLSQLGMTASANLSAELAATVRAMLSIPMPELPRASVTLMASLTASLSAVAQIKLALGVDPLEVGLPRIQMMVAERVSETASLVEQTTGMPLASVVAELEQLAMEYCPTLMAPPAVVQIATSMVLPPIQWNVPVMASLPILSTGLPIAAFAAQLKAALNMQASLTPCANGCDAAALLKAL